MPGAGKQPPQIQDQIKELLEAGFDPTTIHRRLKVGRSSIYRMKRCLEQHGTNYMPKEMNKKNGRPKVLTPEQELEVSAWLRDPKNRTRFLDDLVWLIHDRFGIVCSTTTMSKMKRKWLRVIDYEENGTPIDDTTRAQLEETHPDLPLLHQPHAPVAEMGSMASGLESDGMGMQQPLPPQMEQQHPHPQLEQQHQDPLIEQHQLDDHSHLDQTQHADFSQPQQQHLHADLSQQQHLHPHLDQHSQLDQQQHQQHPYPDHHLQPQQQHDDILSLPPHQQQHHTQHPLEDPLNVYHPPPAHDPQLDAQLEQQIRHSAEMGVMGGHHGQHLGT
ncbi:unnamed protein product [Zymoseptoria tritici ST99CH_1A5]|uniref:Uncharacterized protein n=1 Tax=Zymoseptoria tritici ST99CH_1A5 TaxID=1276529 RepID=A0A1Y6LC30_ZYMTR|nr:unnamed protein product [Zymoseptoria tritici ST99CH_1A5]